jgi:hypothetical protein
MKKNRFFLLKKLLFIFSISAIFGFKVCGDLTIEFGDLTIESRASSWFVLWLESWMNVGLTIKVMNLIHPSLGEIFC